MRCGMSSLSSWSGRSLARNCDEWEGNHKIFQPCLASLPHLDVYTNYFVAASTWQAQAWCICKPSGKVVFNLVNWPQHFEQQKCHRWNVEEPTFFTWSTALTTMIAYRPSSIITVTTRRWIVVSLRMMLNLRYRLHETGKRNGRWGLTKTPNW